MLTPSLSVVIPSATVMIYSHDSMGLLEQRPLVCLPTWNTGEEKARFFNHFDICSFFFFSRSACALYWVNLWRAKSLYVVWHVGKVEKVKGKREKYGGRLLCWAFMMLTGSAALVPFHLVFHLWGNLRSILCSPPLCPPEKHKNKRVSACLISHSTHGQHPS